MAFNAILQAVDAEMTAELQMYQGYSAYEIAIQHGFEGSEAEWLASLHATSATVNGQSRDQDGNIPLTAGHIPVSSEAGAETVAQRLSGLNTALQTKISSADALSAIGQKASTQRFSAALSTSGWSASAPYTQTVNVSGLLATDDPFVDVSLSGASTADAANALMEAWALVGRVTAGAGTLTAYCYEEKPTVAIPLILKVVR